MQQSTGSGNQVEQHLRAQLELLQNHDANASDSRDSRGDDSPSSPGASANGYRELAAASHDAAARARAAKSEAELHIHPELRAQQMLEQQHSHDPSHNMMSMAAHAGHSPGSSPGGPSIAPAPSSSAPEVGSPGTGSKAKRELSQSKRAAQNRAAQRAFRQRKEGYIKKLEQQVRDYVEMEHSFKSFQSENYALREYVLHLQSRLLDATGEYPQPPPNLDLSHAAGGQPPSNVGESAEHSGVGAGTPLEAVAQAVAGLAAQEQLAESQRYASGAFKHDGSEQDTRSADEINRQLQENEEHAGDAAKAAP